MVVKKTRNWELARCSSMQRFYSGIVNFLDPRNLARDRARPYRKLTALCVALLAAPLYGQSDLTVTSQETVSYAAPMVTVQDSSDLQMQNPYLGGVPAGTASSTPLQLSLEDAVARSLRQNLGGLLSGDTVSGSHGERWQALSALLPNVTTATSFGVRQNDLRRSSGLMSPGTRR